MTKFLKIYIHDGVFKSSRKPKLMKWFPIISYFKAKNEIKKWLEGGGQLDEEYREAVEGRRRRWEMGADLGGGQGTTNGSTHDGGDSANGPKMVAPPVAPYQPTVTSNAKWQQFRGRGEKFRMTNLDS